MNQPKNVFGESLIACCTEPATGFYRDGYCRTGAEDAGLHLVCAEVTEDFLQFSKEAGNDLSTPNPLYGFDGLRPGQRWCVCVQRWKEAFDAGCRTQHTPRIQPSRCATVRSLAVSGG